jgi:chitodextrinase
MKEAKGFFCLALLIFLFSAIPLKASGANKIKVPDTKPPTAPGELLITGRTCTSVSLSWSSATDNIKVKGYYVYRDDRKITSTSETSYCNSDLAPATRYKFEIKAFDAAGNISTNGAFMSTVTDPDTLAPTVPGNLSQSACDYTSVTLSWSSSTDNTGVKGYVVYKNGSRVASTTKTNYTVKRLLPGTSHSFYVKAYDKTGNYSGQSRSIPGTTPRDTKAPEKPVGLKGTSVTETQLTLVWSPSSDNVKVKGYEVYCDGVMKGTRTKASFAAKGLPPDKSYKYTVVAIDTSGNRSAYSEPIVIKTLKDDKKPGAPAGLKLVKARGSSVSLEWNASKDNVKVEGYIIYCNGIEVEKAKGTSRTVTNKLKPIIAVYWVKAYDISGNLSDTSNKLTVISP